MQKARPSTHTEGPDVEGTRVKVRGRNDRNVEQVTIQVLRWLLNHLESDIVYTYIIYIFHICKLSKVTPNT